MNKPDWQSTIRASEAAVFLDVDGTLLGFKDRAEDVVADPPLLDLLATLRTACGGAVALVSGRMVADLDRIVAPLVLPAAGVHGADLRFPDGRRETMDGAALVAAREKAECFVGDHPGLRLEDKGAAFAIHYRAVPDLGGEVAACLGRIVTGHDLMIQHGKMVAEVKSARSDKGTAISVLMRESPFEGRRPIFIGDDLTDEHGFSAVNALGGLSIKVGPASEETVAHQRLADPQDVRNFLWVICRSAGNSGEMMVS